MLFPLNSCRSLCSHIYNYEILNIMNSVLTAKRFNLIITSKQKEIINSCPFLASLSVLSKLIYVVDYVLQRLFLELVLTVGIYAIFS